jgi:hypothetical protein
MCGHGISRSTALGFAILAQALLITTGNALIDCKNIGAAEALLPSASQSLQGLSGYLLILIDVYYVLPDEEKFWHTLDRYSRCDEVSQEMLTTLTALGKEWGCPLQKTLTKVAYGLRLD